MSELSRGAPQLTRAAVVLAAVAVSAVTISCTRPLTDVECRQLLDRYTERLAQSENPAILPSEVAHDQMAARAVAARDPRFEFSACSRHVSRASFECAMNASDVDAMERCLVF